jgi:hypothetical protein
VLVCLQSFEKSADISKKIQKSKMQSDDFESGEKTAKK